MSDLEIEPGGVTSWGKFCEEWQDCRRCALGERAAKHVLGSGPMTARAVFIGEGPGLSEDTLGLPFIGRAGRLLRLAIREAGFSPDHVLYTNLVACRPCDEVGGPNRPPKESESDECRPRLESFLAFHRQLRAVVLCGRVPQAMTARLQVPVPEGGYAPMYGIPHPAYVLRSGAQRAPQWRKYVDSIHSILDSVSSKEIVRG